MVLTKAIPMPRPPWARLGLRSACVNSLKAWGSSLVLADPAVLYLD